jgi:hypothetical protein
LPTRYFPADAASFERGWRRSRRAAKETIMAIIDKGFRTDSRATLARLGRIFDLAELGFEALLRQTFPDQPIIPERGVTVLRIADAEKHKRAREVLEKAPKAVIDALGAIGQRMPDLNGTVDDFSSAHGDREKLEAVLATRGGFGCEELQVAEHWMALQMKAVNLAVAQIFVAMHQYCESLEFIHYCPSNPCADPKASSAERWRWAIRHGQAGYAQDETGQSQDTDEEGGSRPRSRRSTQG